MTSSARRIAGAAALIAVITIAARVVGFGRIVVFTWAVGPNDLGNVYQSANTLPNIIFEIVAGGALASLVVPLLAGPIERGDREQVSRITSALLTWTVALLVPLAVLVWLLAEPVMGLLSADAGPEVVRVGAGMLRVFAPQLPLYGIGIVLTGVLQAHHRFAWPALAPLLSSVTVVGAYALFTVVSFRGAGIAEVNAAGVLTLSVGTTLGVAVLSLCLVFPLARLGLRLRPGFALSAQVGGQLRGLAIAGAVTVGAQQVALLVVVYLTNPPALEGTLILYTIAQTLFFLPWGVLAVPVATSAYPALAEAYATGAEARYRRTLAGTMRGVLLLGCVGAAGLVAVAEPAARVIGELAADKPDFGALTAGIAWFAPGLIGYSLFALLTRALYARGQTGIAARVTAVGWGVVIVADLLLVWWLPRPDRVAALAAGNSIGMVVLGALLWWAVGRRAGRTALTGTLRAGSVGIVAGCLAAAAGWYAGHLLFRDQTMGANLGQGLVAGAVTLAVFAAVALLADRGDLIGLVGRLRGHKPPPDGTSETDAGTSETAAGESDGSDASHGRQRKGTVS
ncbi:MAG: murein biosynthesis integral membrane protein MurJ [Micromonosporaceae bacterium]